MLGEEPQPSKRASFMPCTRTSLTMIFSQVAMVLWKVPGEGSTPSSANTDQTSALNYSPTATLTPSCKLRR
eukprot:COSAG02_NODE_5921_length_3939_cov_3.266667_1_plen_71_part_00